MSLEDIEFCGDLLVKVSEQLVHEFNKGFQSRTILDMMSRFNESNGLASREIKSALTQRFPEIQWLDTEFDRTRYELISEGYYWVCDPIDGALNFLQGIPFWSLSLCLLHNGKPEMSMVYDPCRKELFHAYVGQGAYRNGSRIRVSETYDICNSILATAHPTFVQEYKEDTERTAKDVYQTLPNARAVRMMGTVSLQLAYVASGRFDGYWEHGYDMYDWWAGALLVQEAGGIVTGMCSEKFTWGATGIIAANSVLYSKLKTQLNLLNASRLP